MKKILGFILGLLCLVLSGCSSLYYSDKNLNLISIGDSKEQIMSRFQATKKDGDNVPGMQIRAARRNSSGKLIEVGEVPLLTQTGGGQVAIPYWFLFENGRLAQWGRPEDWQSSAARYDIHFNPSPGVR